MKTAILTGLAGLAMAGSAMAGQLTPEQARHFVAEKLFSYTCFDGTTGAGRIRNDGSAVGTIRPQGQGPLRYISLPPGTIKLTSNSICATMKNMLFEPCFNVSQTSQVSFRGSLTLLSFAYCDFTRLNNRRLMTAGMPVPRPLRTAAPRPAPVTPVTAEALPPPKPAKEAAAEASSQSSVDLRPSKD